MARTKKDRTEEVKAVFNGLKYCSASDLKQVIKKANSMLDDAKKVEIEAKKNQIEQLKKELAELER